MLTGKKLSKRLEYLHGLFGWNVRFYPDGTDDAGGDLDIGTAMDGSGEIEPAVGGAGEPSTDLGGGGEPAGGAPAAEEKWADYGLEQFDGLKRKDIAEQIKYTQQLYGRQSNEYGSMKKKLAEYEERLAKFQQIANPNASAGATTQQAADAFPEMTKGQLEDFYQQFELNPAKAIHDLLKDKMGRRSDEDITKLVNERINESLWRYHQYNESQQVASDPDYNKHQAYIDLLKEPENLGTTRSAKDLLEFSRLHEQNKALANLVYDRIKRYPQMPFTEAKEWAEMKLRQGEVISDKVKQIKGQVDGIQGGSLGGTAAKGSAGENIETLDDAFDIRE